MRMLLDTHTFLWFILDDPKLSVTARQHIEEGMNTVFVSPVTPWEIAIKVSIQKLNLTEPFGVLVPREIQSNNFILLPITVAHASAVASLPYHHRDPFDRMLIAQAIVEGIPLLSVDAQFDAYGVNRVW